MQGECEGKGGGTSCASQTRTECSAEQEQQRQAGPGRLHVRPHDRLPREGRSEREAREWVQQGRHMRAGSCRAQWPREPVTASRTLRGVSAPAFAQRQNKEWQSRQNREILVQAQVREGQGSARPGRGAEEVESASP